MFMMVFVMVAIASLMVIVPWIALERMRLFSETIDVIIIAIFKIPHYQYSFLKNF